MKSMKKFLALALALALCFAMAIPAMATEEGGEAVAKTQTLTLENPTPGHTYSVYQIFTGDVGEKDGKDALANIKYGVNFGGFGADEAVGTAVDSSVTDAILDAGEGFASDLLAALRGDAYQTMGPAEEGNPLTVEVETGYYLIVDNGSDADDTVSALMVQIIGDTSVKTKTTDTTMDKTVETVKPGEFTDDAGHTIGEVFQFKLEAKIPVAQLSSFDKYMIRFKDTMSAGLTYAGNMEVQVEGEPSKEIPAKSESADGYVFNYTNSDYEPLQEEPKSKAGVSFTVEITDLFEFIGEKDWPTVTDEETGLEYVKVVLTYDAYLNENAIVMGSGTEENGTELGDDNANKNTGSLDFTRNPDNEEEGSTTPDETYVFTLKIDGTKYKDEIGDKNLLEGAGFTLYYAEQDGDKWTKGEAINFKKNDKGDFVVYTGNETEGVTKEIKTGTDGKFVFNGLGPGNYILSETTVPEGGYNRSADILITVTEGEKDPDTHTITCTVTKKYIGNEDVTDEDADKLNQDAPVAGDGAAIQVVNKTGTLLPSTGGIGTTIFYAVGAALVVGAGILLFVKKRMGSKG